MTDTFYVLFKLNSIVEWISVKVSVRPYSLIVVFVNGISISFKKKSVLVLLTNFSVTGFDKHHGKSTNNLYYCLFHFLRCV